MVTERDIRVRNLHAMVCQVVLYNGKKSYITTVIEVQLRPEVMPTAEAVKESKRKEEEAKVEADKEARRPGPKKVEAAPTGEPKQEAGSKKQVATPEPGDERASMPIPEAPPGNPLSNTPPEPALGAARDLQSEATAEAEAAAREAFASVLGLDADTVSVATDVANASMYNVD